METEHRQEPLDAPDRIEAYYRRVFRRILLAWLATATGIAVVWFVTAGPGVRDRVVRFEDFPPTDFVTVLTGLAGLVIAAQVLARGMGRSTRQLQPESVDFIAWCCILLLVLDLGTTTLGVIHLLDFSPWPKPPLVDPYRFIGLLAYGVLIAMFASDAVEHAGLGREHQEAYRTRNILRSRALLSSFPRVVGGRRHLRRQLRIYYVALPLVCGALGWILFVPTTGLLAMVASLPLLALTRARQMRACSLRQAEKIGGWIAHLGAGIWWWSFFAAIFLATGLSIVYERMSQNERAPELDDVTRVLALYVVVTLVPALGAVWFARTAHSTRGTGFVLAGAIREEQRKLRRLRTTTPKTTKQTMLRSYLVRLIRRHTDATEAQNTDSWVSRSLFIGAVIGVTLLVVWLVMAGPMVLSDWLSSLG